MPRYSIHDFSGGEVDKEVLSKLDQNYRRKLLKGENIYITKRNTLKTRPSILKDEDSDRTNVVDAIQYKGETVYLQINSFTLEEDISGLGVAGEAVDLSNNITGIEDDVFQTAFDTYKDITSFTRVIPDNGLFKVEFKKATIGDIDVVTIKEPNLIEGRELTSVIFLKGGDTYATHFTDSQLIKTVLTDSRTNTGFNQGTLLLSNRNYLPSELIYNSIDNNIILNMLGELYTYDGERLKVISGSNDNINTRDVIKLKRNLNKLESIPLIAQVYPDVDDITTNVPYNLKGTISDIVDSTLNTHDDVRRAMQVLGEQQDNIKFNLLDLTLDAIQSNSLTKLQYRRVITPDVKFIAQGGDLNLGIQQLSSSGDKKVYLIDPTMVGIKNGDDYEGAYDTYSNSLSGIFKNDDKEKFPNGYGTAIGTDGFCICVQEDGSSRSDFLFGLTNPVRETRVTGDFTGATDAYPLAENNTTVSTVIKINIDFSHPDVVNYMNNLRCVQFYRSLGESNFEASILVNAQNNQNPNIDLAETTLAVQTTGTLRAFLKSQFNAYNNNTYTMLSNKINEDSVRANEGAYTRYTDSFRTVGTRGSVYSGSLTVEPWLSNNIGHSTRYPFSTDFKASEFLNETDRVAIINNRLVIAEEDINYSSFSKPSVMNTDYKAFIADNIFISKDLEYIRNSGVDININIDNNDPQNYGITDEIVTNVSLLDVRSNNEGVITTNKRLLRAAGNGSLQIPVLTEIDDIGCDKNALTKYTSSIISSQGGDVRQTLYSDRVNGFVSNLINEETELPPIIDMVQMITKHRVILCLHEKQEDTPQQITCFSLGSEAQIKGLTKWVSNFTADKFVKVSEDKVLLVGTEGTRIIDFDKGFTGDDYDKDTESEIKPIEWVIRPTPIRFNTDNSISVMKPHSIADLAIGATGQVKFDVILENYVNGKRIVKTVRETVRGIGDVDNYTGVVVFRGLPSIASELPVLEIRGTGSVTEISSIDMMLRS